MVNPFSAVLDKLQLKSDSQGAGYRFSYLYTLLKVGAALHAADPQAWNASSQTAGDEVLYRLRAIAGDTFSLRDIRTFFVEARIV